MAVQAPTGSDPALSASPWWQQDAQVCWHPYTQHGLDPQPLAVVGARGAWLELADGQRMLDAISSWWACLHGHGNHRLVAAAAAQAARLDHVLFAGCTHEPAVNLATDLVRVAAPMAGGGHSLQRVFYSDNGSTAVEVALKAAYQYWVRQGEPQRTRFIALDGGYHGDTFGAMAVGEPHPFFHEFAPFLFEVVRVPPSAEALQQALQANAGQVAALIVEPLVQGAAGMVMHPASFLQDARRLCDEHGALLIADEVLTGFGRTGSVFACEKAGICPDLMALAKGLTGGMLPLAVTMASEEIYQAFHSPQRERAFFHGHTFTANPIGCAIGHASLALLHEQQTPARLDRIGAWIEARLRARLGEASGVRRCGGIVAVEPSEDSAYLAAGGEELRQACRGLKRVLLRPLGNVLYAMPPACLEESEALLVADAMVEVLTQTATP